MLIAALAFAIMVLTALAAIQMLGRWADNETWRIFFAFIAEEGCDMPHEFAACIFAGNKTAIAEKFPQFKQFAERYISGDGE